jgi:HAD superfamily hydrolase (TIGR01549 family)
MKKKLISFDLDQTLIETKAVHYRAWKIAFEKSGLKAPSKYRIFALLDGRNALEVAKALLPNFSMQKLRELRNFHHEAVRKTAKYARQIDGASEVIRKLRKKYKIALLSNCSHIEMNALLKATGLSKKLFDVIIGHGDVKRTKPFPDEIFKAEKILKMNAEYHIGDSIYDLLAANRAKVKGIAVLSGITHKQKLLKYNPCFIIKDISQLSKLL